MSHEAAFEGVLNQAQNLTKTQILILGTNHFNGTEGFKPQYLDTLIEHLTDYAPDVTAIENLSPELIAAMEAEGGIFKQGAERFAGGMLRMAARAQTLLGYDRPTAKEQVKRLQAQDTATLGPAEKTQLVMNLLAAYDLNNAALQWRYLSADGHGVDIAEDIAQALDVHLESPNETASIVLKLASRLGHQQVFCIDDHRDAGLLEFYGEALEEITSDMMKAHIAKIPPLQEADRRFAEGLERGDLWEYMLFVNSPGFMRALVDTEVGGYYSFQLPSGVDRMRAAQWEVRNLYMAGNIRYASALYPGGRVLAVVGYSHKPFLDRYLAQLTDVQLVYLGDL